MTDHPFQVEFKCKFAQKFFSTELHVKLRFLAINSELKEGGYQRT